MRESGGRPKAWLAWSSGKDSAWALHTVRREGEFDVVAFSVSFEWDFVNVLTLLRLGGKSTDNLFDLVPSGHQERKRYAKRCELD